MGKINQKDPLRPNGTPHRNTRVVWQGHRMAPDETSRWDAKIFEDDALPTVSPWAWRNGPFGTADRHNGGLIDSIKNSPMKGMLKGNQLSIPCKTKGFGNGGA